MISAPACTMMPLNQTATVVAAVVMKTCSRIDRADEVLALARATAMRLISRIQIRKVGLCAEGRAIEIVPSGLRHTHDVILLRSHAIMRVRSCLAVPDGRKEAFIRTKWRLLLSLLNLTIERQTLRWPGRCEIIS